MKKIFLTGLFLMLMFSFCNMQIVFANSLKDIDDIEATSKKENKKEVKKEKDTSTTSKEIKNAIEAYKQGDYLACISILKEYTAKNDKNAVAWYYLGSSYMNIAMTNEASEAFDKVISLNSINSSPKLTSYAIQAQLCMKTPDKCKYENFTAAEVKKLKENPTKFIADYYKAQRDASIKSDDVIQIENLINGTYSNNIHPQAQDFILNERAKIKASQINSGKS